MNHIDHRPAETVRLRTARQKYAEARRTERLARIAAADELRARARRRRAGVRLALLAATLVTVVLLAITVTDAVLRHRDADRLDRHAAAREAAISAVTTMLDADPARPDEYLRAALAVTTGQQHERLEKATPALREAVTGLGRPATGQVLSAGVAADAGDRVDVVLVAQASAPELIGAEAAANRVALRVTMVRHDGTWLVGATEPVS